MGIHVNQDGARSAGQRAVIGGLRSVGHSAVPAMVYWAISRAVYLYIATFGMNVRFCRIQVGRRP
jgi:hypothetical protein